MFLAPVCPFHSSFLNWTGRKGFLQFNEISINTSLNDNRTDTFKCHCRYTYFKSTWMKTYTDKIFFKFLLKEFNENRKGKIIDEMGDWLPKLWLCTKLTVWDRPWISGAVDGRVKRRSQHLCSSCLVAFNHISWNCFLSLF